MSLVKPILVTTDKIIGNTLRVICIFCFSVLFLLLAGNVLVRYFPFMSFHWFDEIVEWAFAWLVFFGCAALWRENEHFRIQWIQQKLGKNRYGSVIKTLLDLLSVMFFIVLAYQGYRFASRAMDWTSFFNIPRKIIYSCIPVSGAIMLIYSIKDLIRDFKNNVLGFK